MTTAPVLRSVTAEVVAVRPDGAAQLLTLAVPSAVRAPRPGQFVQVPPLPGEAAVLPQTWWLAGGREDPLHGTSLEVTVPEAGWQPGDAVTAHGPLGRGFPLPVEPVAGVVVGHGLAQAPARWLTELLRGRGCSTVLVLSSSSGPEGHLDLARARRVADRVLLTTPPRLADALREVGPVDVVYAAGPAEVTTAAAAAAQTLGVPSQVTAYDAGGAPSCGVGLCRACEVTVSGAGGPLRLRPCVDGPVVSGDRLTGPRSPR